MIDGPVYCLGTKDGGKGEAMEGKAKQREEGSYKERAGVKTGKVEIKIIVRKGRIKME